ncbi:Linoleate 9S-lipoxygenase-4 [Glycine soja]|uniref:Linoleate 9S-lipoxygenase-4 n=1 Tax=Glycine soja TaxID=3848 RepID=A0A445M1W1_GLYSO|nr:Linoleate 9S-lipoxygenase-4 [Glycine soja]
MSLDDSSISLGLERIRECSRAISNACILHTDQVVSEKLILSGGKAVSKEKISLDEFKGCPQDEAEANIQGKEHELSYIAQEHRPREAVSQEEFQDFDMSKRKRKNWWKRFVNIKKSGEGNVRSKLNAGTNKTRRIKVKQNKKRWLEFSGLYLGQEVRAHKGLVWTMKFSPRGQYLASGDEDGVVRIWCVTSLDKSNICFTPQDNTSKSKVECDNSSPRKKHLSQPFVCMVKVGSIQNSEQQIQHLAPQAVMGAFDGIIDTVFAVHPLLPLIGLLKSHGKIVMVGAPEKPLELPVFPLLAVIEILSRHASDEFYLGQRDGGDYWTSDAGPLEAFKRFGKNLEEIENKLIEKNNDETLRNRYGPAKMPYTLLYPSSKEGLTFRGIPNSISI